EALADLAQDGHLAFRPLGAEASSVREREVAHVVLQVGTGGHPFSCCDQRRAAVLRSSTRSVRSQAKNTSSPSAAGSVYASRPKCPYVAVGRKMGRRSPSAWMMAAGRKSKTSRTAASIRSPGTRPVPKV